jgi:hypothetical protein
VKEVNVEFNVRSASQNTWDYRLGSEVKVRPVMEVLIIPSTTSTNIQHMDRMNIRLKKWDGMRIRRFLSILPLRA